MRHFIDLYDWSATEIAELLADARQMKGDWAKGIRPLPLGGRILGLIFEKPSLRTRVSFESAMAHLGGQSIFLSNTDGPIGKRESVPDFARTLSQFVDVVVLRVFSQKTVETFAEYGSVPIINGLSDLSHPCQALGDILTLQEVFGDVKGRTLVFVGDCNNVSRSLALICAKVGMKFVLSAPKGYGFDAEFLRSLTVAEPRHQTSEIADPREAVRQADAVYSDVFTSMGQEDETQKRLAAFSQYKVTQGLMSLTPAHAKYMHCLPAHRGEEVDAEVIDGPQSVVFPQAGNRMHGQKAVLKRLLTGGSGTKA
jgi:ornithine carbamoyltransferase